MKTNNELTIYGLNESIAYCEAMGLAKCFEAYAEECPSEWITQVGFNSNSGYVYIALENGIQIASMLGKGVEYLVSNLENGYEDFFLTYEEAEEHLLNANA